MTLPEGITGFGQALDTRFAKRVDLLTGALPAQYGYREAGVIEIETKTAFENGGRVDMYGGSHDTVQPSFELGGSQGKASYYLTGSYLHNIPGSKTPLPAPNAIHDQHDQFKGFGYASYLTQSKHEVERSVRQLRRLFSNPQPSEAAPDPDYLGRPGRYSASTQAL